jgi:sugar/nucleoside kinase (ribokinase family)
MTVDILGLGAVTTDQLLYVASFPGPDAKSPVLRTETQCGGLTATALVAAARLGARCAYAGQLGPDDASRFVRETFVREGVDVQHVVDNADARAIRSVIVVGMDNGSRNIFPYIPGQTGAHATLPAADVVRSARVLLVDHFGVEGMLRAVKLAREAGRAVVSDIERIETPAVHTLLGYVDHVVMSAESALPLTGSGDAASAARALWQPGRAAVVITSGAQGAYFTDDGTTVLHQPAYAVNVVDTTGCGDVFHGAYCALLAEKHPLAERVRLASAAAALKATQPGGQSGAPTMAALRAFVEQNTLGS